MTVNKLSFVLILLLSFLFSGVSNAASDKIYTSTFSDKSAGGYDVVSYFTQNQAIKGNSKHTYTYQGAKWLFSSKQNLDLFKANPSKYAPQYGGYCAWAVSNGYLASGDPKQWTIVNNKLYLNYNRSIKNKWLKNKNKLIIKSDKQWPAVLK